jgi:hypothetical protein
MYEGNGMNFYKLSNKLHLSVDKLYSLYQELFPNIKIYSYTNTLLKEEIERLTTKVNINNKLNR